MKWIEEIKVQIDQTEAYNFENILQQLFKDIQENADCEGLSKAAYYHDPGISGFYMIHIFWHVKSSKEQWSRLGLRLTQILKEFGWVTHSVWIESKCVVPKD
ncbi:MAG: hypothetical protein HQK76_03080 [Desulfobacterales bacterium]|nr:hypothetical protein [Desulfobacterales bacterium]